MARFIYRMQSVLNIKKKLEEQARMEFGEARVRLSREEEKLSLLTDRKEAYEQKGRELRKNGLKVLDILENRDAISRMEEFIADQRKAVQKAQQQLETARIRLQEAMQESKTQEKLREKAFDEFRREENAKEAREIDELVSYTHAK